MSREELLMEFLFKSDLYRWKDLPLKTYPAAGMQSKGMSKQVLFEGTDELPMEIRYFESEPGGYSALEIHEHVHFVLILRGFGHVLLGDRVRPFRTNDTIHIPTETYHQFYAPADSYMGFLCMVKRERDRPRRPGDDEIRRLHESPDISDWIRY